jgi:hypothetical protein
MSAFVCKNIQCAGIFKDHSNHAVEISKFIICKKRKEFVKNEEFFLIGKGQ